MAYHIQGWGSALCNHNHWLNVLNGPDSSCFFLSFSLSLVSYVSRFTIFSKGHTHNLIFQFCEVSQTSSSPPNLVVSGSQYPSPLDTTDPCLASSPLHILLLFYDWSRHAHHHHLICLFRRVWASSPSSWSRARRHQGLELAVVMVRARRRHGPSSPSSRSRARRRHGLELAVDVEGFMRWWR